MVKEEYTGQLIGGPDDGNIVTSTTMRIPTVGTTELWLDGTGRGKSAFVIITRGFYLWNQDKGYFTWQLVGSDIEEKIAA